MIIGEVSASSSVEQGKVWPESEDIFQDDLNGIGTKARPIFGKKDFSTGIAFGTLPLLASGRQGRGIKLPSGNSSPGK